eukprot:Cvel_35114.t1-p1 / transcript=Cvel_35114.t1 / gene=Cvel_35114 / organism=Chromera_velia_CCMP2878 / gene_product=hypothetical protein / transcript_product=hypothetical protein / location=Cvel_scaffold6290:1-1744(-) / protein_length=376 / sequence_SO=supercontig / SO=protein_coding / is_pseudo=false
MSSIYGGDKGSGTQLPLLGGTNADLSSHRPKHTAGTGFGTLRNAGSSHFAAPPGGSKKFQQSDEQSAGGTRLSGHIPLLPGIQIYQGGGGQGASNSLGVGSGSGHSHNLFGLQSLHGGSSRDGGYLSAAKGGLAGDAVNATSSGNGCNDLSLHAVAAATGLFSSTHGHFGGAQTERGTERNSHALALAARLEASGVLLKGSTTDRGEPLRGRGSFGGGGQSHGLGLETSHREGAGASGTNANPGGSAGSSNHSTSGRRGGDRNSRQPGPLVLSLQTQPPNGPAGVQGTSTTSAAMRGYGHSPQAPPRGAAAAAFSALFGASASSSASASASAAAHQLPTEHGVGGVNNAGLGCSSSSRSSGGAGAAGGGDKQPSQH